MGFRKFTLPKIFLWIRFDCIFVCGCQRDTAGCRKGLVPVKDHNEAVDLRTGTRMKTKLVSLTLRAKENPKAKFNSLIQLSEDFLIQCFPSLKGTKLSQ